ncbi:MAG: methyltransferase domain-containing protein [Gammaproteobacteria bacterium]|nr:methyltransferase domain-containing protein [Gammaproteobacteria bacterium]
MDVGCGSGIHSYAALRAGARRVHGFDYDANSVKAAMTLRSHAGDPDTWTVERGDVLDDEFLARIGALELCVLLGRTSSHRRDVARDRKRRSTRCRRREIFHRALLR